MTIDTSQFLQTFYEESFEGLDTMESNLLNLDAGAADPEVVNTIFRAAHSIKGGSATFGLSEVAAFTHVLETLLDEMRGGARAVTAEAVNVLLAAVDCLREMLGAIQRGDSPDQLCAPELQAQMQQMLDNGGDAAATVAATASSGSDGAVEGWCIEFRPHAHLFSTGNDPLRIFRELSELGNLEVSADVSALPELPVLDPEASYLAWRLELHADVPRSAVEEAFAWVDGDCDLKIDPLHSGGKVTNAAVGHDDGAVSGELVMERRQEAERRTGDRRVTAAGGMDGTSIRVGIDKVDTVINLVGELVITQSMLSTMGENFTIDKLHQLHGGLVQLERNTRELQEQVMRMRMLPMGFVFNRFPRMVHDISAKLGKQVRLDISGETTELDKTVIEKISDPLVHLVRNALDHGLEDPEQRHAAGKPETGVVSLNAYHKGGNIIIEVSDDGRGLDTDKIRAKAVERGLVQADVQMTSEQIYELLFLPGFSTAESVSDLSGRGVGMDVVRRNIQSLGGGIEVSSEVGRGSTFSVRLPLTLAILDGQTVSVGDETYIVPLVSIIESMQVSSKFVNHVAGRAETFSWRGEYLPIIRLYDVFSAGSGVTELNDGLLVVVEGDGRRVGLFVDELLGQQQVVIKSLESNYKKVEGISGATILGDGSVALILDIPGLIRTSNQETTHEYRKRA